MNALILALSLVSRMQSSGGGPIAGETMLTLNGDALTLNGDAITMIF